MRGLKRQWTRGFRKVGGWRGSSRASACKAYILYRVVQHSAPMLCRGKRDADLDAVIRAGRPYVKTSWSCSWSLVGAHPPSKTSSSRSPVAALAMRSRTDVSAFALVVYWHDPDGTPIVAARFPGSTAWRCRGRFLGALNSNLKQYITPYFLFL